MADDKPKPFNPAGADKPLFRAVKATADESVPPTSGNGNPLFRAMKGASGSTESHAQDGDQPTFRAVQSKDHSSDSPHDGGTAQFRPVKGAGNDIDAPKQEEQPMFRAAQAVPVSPNKSVEDIKSRPARGGLYPQSKPSRKRKPAAQKSRQSSSPRKPLKVTAKAEPELDVSPKSGITTLILCLFLGWFGGHRFYSGYTGLGFLYMFTAGLFFIGWIVDLINILSGRYRDKDNKLIRL